MMSHPGSRPMVATGFDSTQRCPATGPDWPMRIGTSFLPVIIEVIIPVGPEVKPCAGSLVGQKETDPTPERSERRTPCPPISTAPLDP
jgi:hypothetical protein